MTRPTKTAVATNRGLLLVTGLLLVMPGCDSCGEGKETGEGTTATPERNKPFRVQWDGGPRRHLRRHYREAGAGANDGGVNDGGPSVESPPPQ